MSELLRQKIESCGMTRAELSRASGVPQSGLSRFTVNGEGLRSANLDKLCATLGLTLTSVSKAPKRRAKK